MEFTSDAILNECTALVLPVYRPYLRPHTAHTLPVLAPIHRPYLRPYTARTPPIHHQYLRPHTALVLPIHRQYLRPHTDHTLPVLAPAHCPHTALVLPIHRPYLRRPLVLQLYYLFSAHTPPVLAPAHRPHTDHTCAKPNRATRPPHIMSFNKKHPRSALTKRGLTYNLMIKNYSTLIFTTVITSPVEASVRQNVYSPACNPPSGMIVIKNSSPHSSEALSAINTFCSGSIPGP